MSNRISALVPLCFLPYFLMGLHSDVKNIIAEAIIKATSTSIQSHILPVSNLDLLSGHAPVTYLYVYHKPLFNSNKSFVQTLKSSLPTAFNHYYPFAGQMVSNGKMGEPEIICDNHGALLVEAYIDIPLVSLDFHDLNQSLGKLVSVNHDFPFIVQITKYSCGGAVITFTFDHLLGDASSLGKFLESWCEIAQGKPISCVPNHQRTLPAHMPPTYEPSLDNTFISYDMVDIVNMLTNDIELRHLYHVDAEAIDRLQRLSGKSTKIEALSAYVWKIMGRAVGDSATHCKMGWLVDGRRRLNRKAPNMSNYVGNVLLMAVGEVSVEDLKGGRSHMSEGLFTRQSRRRQMTLIS